jgi:hypothetical protein
VSKLFDRSVIDEIMEIDYELAIAGRWTCAGRRGCWGALALQRTFVLAIAA